MDSQDSGSYFLLGHKPVSSPEVTAQCPVVGAKCVLFYRTLGCASELLREKESSLPESHYPPSDGCAQLRFCSAKTKVCTHGHRIVGDEFFVLELPV